MRVSINRLDAPSSETKWLEVAAWFVVSAIASTYFNTAFLKEFGGDAFALTLFRFVGSSLLGFLSNVVGSADTTISTQKFAEVVPSFVLPATCLLGANLFNSISLDRGGITLTYVVKAGIPLVTVIICVFKGQRVTGQTALALIPTVIGVALSAWADTDFAVEGFIAAWLSTICQALLNVTSKTSIRTSGLSGQRSQFILVTLASAGMILVDTAFGSLEWNRILAKLAESDKAKAIVILTAFSYHVEYVLNFIVTENVAEVHFSVLDVARRLSIILAGAFLFGKVLTPLNIVGVVLALSGVLLYNRVKRRESDADSVDPHKPKTS